MMMDFVRDLRLAARTLSKARGFSAVAILTLALGMALNATVLAVVNAYLFKSLPYPGSKRLYNVLYSRPGQDYPRGLQNLDWQSLADVIEHPISWDLDMFYLIGGDHPETAPGAWVTSDFMQGLGVQTSLGRTFSKEEFQPGSPQVALISHSLWQNRFGGDPAILGRRFEAYVSDRPQEPEAFTVIGILPAGFWHVNRYTEVFAPLRAPSYPYMLRLREGVPAGEAERRITELVKRGAASLPPGWQAQLRSTHGEYVTRVRQILIAVAAAASLVLVIACANVAFLSLIRATRRRKEIALRLALGATRGGIARMLIAEALLLGLVATAAGIALSRLALGSLAPIVQQQLERPAPGGASAIDIDGTVLAAAAACCVLTAALFALAPLLTLWGRGADLTRPMHNGSRSGTEGPASRRARAALIVLEVAASLALLAGCGLMLRTVTHLQRVDFGYRMERVLTARLGLRERNYPDAAARSGFYQRFLARVSAIPGVTSAALAERSALVSYRPQPLETETSAGKISFQGTVLAASAEYFATMGVPLAEGRAFTWSDRGGAEPVALVSETLARRIWPETSALGRRILVVNRALGDPPAAPPVSRTVVGVVRDVRQTAVDEDLMDLYLPLLQTPGRFASLFVRTEGVPSSWVIPLRRALKEIDPEITLDAPRPLAADSAEQLSRPKFLAAVLTGFALFATMLALVAVYGVIAYAVRQREREIAVRMALGAQPRAVTLMFLKQGGAVILIGITAGLFGAAALGRALQSQIYGVRSSDPSTLLAAALVFAAAGLLAVWRPASRAARTDPILVLREE